jgi:hypothetical protein
MGVVVFFALTDRPREAQLADRGGARRPREGELRRERERTPPASTTAAWRPVQNAHRSTSLLSLAYFCGNARQLRRRLLPAQDPDKLVRQTLQPAPSCASSSLPYIVMLLAQIVDRRRSDRTGERWLHAAVPVVLGGDAWPARRLARDPDPDLVVVRLTLAGSAATARLLALPTASLQGTAAAGGHRVHQLVRQPGRLRRLAILGKGSKLTGSYDIGLYMAGGLRWCLAAIIFAWLAWQPAPGRPRPARLAGGLLSSR